MPGYEPFLLCDFHVHTTWSDGKLSVGEVVDLYGSTGKFDVLAITDHILMQKDLLARAGRLATLGRRRFGLREEDFGAYLADILTFYNERNTQVRGLEKGAWAREIQRGSLAITGFGYFAERAEVDGFSYYITSVGGTGARYPDPKSAFFASEDNFILMTFQRDPRSLRVELRNMTGTVLDGKDFAPRERAR